MKQFLGDQSVTESGCFIYLSSAGISVGHSVSRQRRRKLQCRGTKAARPQALSSDMDKQQMRAATGGEDKSAFLSATVASAKSQPAGLLHWTLLLIHQNAYARSPLRTHARAHEIVSKASLILRVLIPSLFLATGLV